MVDCVVTQKMRAVTMLAPENVINYQKEPSDLKPHKV